MVRGKKQGDDLASLNAIEARLSAELKDISRRKAAAQAKVQDAGRGTFMAALEKVRIGSMDEASARAIAKAIGSLGGDTIATRLAEPLPA